MAQVTSNANGSEKLNKKAASEAGDLLSGNTETPIKFRARKFYSDSDSNHKNDKPIKENRKDKKEKNNSPSKRTLKILGFVLLGGFSLVVIVFLVWYMSVAQQLPSVDDLQEKASQFETARILDRNGNLLYEIIDPNAGRRDYVPLSEISPYMVAATIATEDKDFYNHPGFDVFAMVRALIQNLQSGTTVSGASTITQQLARNLLLSPEERSEQSFSRKTKEIFLAAEITRRYSKDQILELYLNENNYGNHAYGIEAAAKTYFGIPAKFVNLAQSSFLAGLPQAPAYYDVFTNYEATLSRQESVLLLMYLRSKEADCIYVSNSSGRVCVDELDVDRSIREMKDYAFEQTEFSMKYPHWVNYIRTVLEQEYGAQAIYRSGFTIYTSIDPELQDLAQQVMTDQIASMAAHDARNGALVAIQPENGEILAMVGSPDFNDNENSGQINMATSPRQPGSAIKPLIYAAAFEKGWTPATLIWDIETAFSPTGIESDLAYSEPYIPENYDGLFHGPVLARDALANSYNIPAVKALEFVHIYDDPVTDAADGFIAFAKRFHLDSLDKPGFGLSLALGGGEVTLLELTNAFAVFANNGAYVPVTPILKILNNKDEIIYESNSRNPEQIIKEEYSYQISSILSDPVSRAPMFGQDSVLNQPFPAAVKTGTTNDFRDNWTVGYTPDLAVGVWIGNADYKPMISTTGLSGAAPAWSEFFRSAEYIISNNRPSSFSRPAGIVENTICSVSGTLPSDYCPTRKTEIFAYNQLPLPASDDLWKPAIINTWNGRMANEYCPEFTEQVMTINITEPDVQQWLLTTREGIAWGESMNLITQGKPPYFTPALACDASTASPVIQFINLSDQMELTSNIVEVYAVINSSTGIQSYSLEFGLGENPQEWFVVANVENRQIYNPEKVADWYLNGLENGIYTLRLNVISSIGTVAERRILVRVNLPSLQQENPVLVPVYGTEELIPEFFQQTP